MDGKHFCSELAKNQRFCVIKYVNVVNSLRRPEVAIKPGANCAKTMWQLAKNCNSPPKTDVNLKFGKNIY